MKVINDGKHITIKASYFETALLTEAIRKGAQAYEKEGSEEFAKQARAIVEEIANQQEVRANDRNNAAN